MINVAAYPKREGVRPPVVATIQTRSPLVRELGPGEAACKKARPPRPHRRMSRFRRLSSRPRVASPIIRTMERPMLQLSVATMLRLVACIAFNIWLFRLGVFWGILGLNVTKHVMIAYLCRRRRRGSPPTRRARSRLRGSAVRAANPARLGLRQLDRRCFLDRPWSPVVGPLDFEWCVASREQTPPFMEGPASGRIQSSGFENLTGFPSQEETRGSKTSREALAGRGRARPAANWSPSSCAATVLK